MPTDQYLDIEEEARNYLAYIDSQYRSSCFGYSGIKGDSPEYQMLRRAIGVTGGGEWRKYISTIPVKYSNKKNRAEEKVSEEIFYQVKSLGWSKIDIDCEELDRILCSCEINTYSQRASIIDPQSSKRFLRLIPTEVYRSIKRYLGTSRIWICNPIILHSKPFEHSPTQKDLSDQAFLFHRDVDSTATVKIFINLSSTEAGNHEYFQKSHYTGDREISPRFITSQPPLFHHEFFAQTIYETHLHQGRFSSQSLINLFGRDNLIKMSTDKGFAWVEDTYGLHRGTPCIDGERKVLSISILKHPCRI